MQGISTHPVTNFTSLECLTQFETNKPIYFPLMTNNIVSRFVIVCFRLVI